jgi:outer membrane protein TolC
MISLASAALAVALAQTQPPKPQQQPAAPATPPAAQAAPAQPAAPLPVLTLDDALRLSAERNLGLKVSEARLRQSEQGLWKAWSGYLPQVTAEGRYTRSYPVSIPFPVSIANPPAGAPAGTPPSLVNQSFPVIPRDQLLGQIDATQMLFSPSIFFGIRAAGKGEDAARSFTENQRRQILFGTAQAYYLVASLKQATEVNERLLEIAQRQEKDARVRYQAGTIAKVALLRAEIDRARAEQDLLRARNAFESARLALANALDRPADFAVQDPPEPKLPPDGKLEEVALRDRADVAAARSALDSAQSQQKAVWSGYLPNVAAFGHYQNANRGGLTGAETWYFGLSARWTLLDGGLREATVRETNAKVYEAETTLALTENQARLEVRQAVLDLESARANAQKAREQRDLATENQRLVDVSFRAGAATAVEQADATAALRNAEIAQQTETLSAQLAALRVIQAVGGTLR